jgi:hypothetical protein
LDSNYLQTIIGSSVSEPDLDWIQIQSGQWIRIRDQDSESGFGIRIRDPDSGSGFGIRIRDPDSGFGFGIRIRDPDLGSGFGIRIQIQEGRNYQQKQKKVRNIMLLSAACSLLRVEGLYL